MTASAAPDTAPSASAPAFAPASARCPFDHRQPSGQTGPTGCPVSAGAAAFDPFSDGYQQDPPEYVRWAREQEPVFYSPQLGYWVVTRFDDIKAVFRDNIAFSPSIALEKITPTGEEANAVLASYGFALNRTLVNEDEPAHMPRRRALMDPFTPEELRHHEPMVRELARAYVDRFIDDGRADLVDQMLWEVPLTVALHFLGVPEEDMDRLREYSIAHTVNTWGRPRPEQQVAVAHAVGNFWQLAGKVLAKMRENPDAPGWMQYGIRKQKELPEVVTDSYLHSMMMAGIVAAHETTANATANAVKLLLQHPGAWKQICENPALIPNAVEECLRHNGSGAARRRPAPPPRPAVPPTPGGGPLNILGTPVIRALTAQLAELAERPGLHCLVLRGSGTRAFVAGADIREMASLNAASARAFISGLRDLCNAVRHFPVPVIARLQGHTLGGGLELAMAADLRIAADDAVVGMPEVKVGIPSVIHAAMMPAQIGGTRASWLLLTGENIGALQAERWGLLNECVPGDQLDARIAQIAEGLGGIGIEALRQQKRLLRRWEGMGVDSAITDSVAEFGAAFNTGEPQHHMNAFLERKQAKAQAQPQPQP